MEDHAFRLHLGDAAVDDLLLHLEVGNTVTQQAAGLGVLLVDMDIVAGARELLRGRHAGRARADDGDLLAGLRCRRLRLQPAILPRLVDDRAFDRLDGDRLVLEIQRAGGLARRRANAARELRKIIGRVQVARRLLPLAMIDEIIPVRDLIVHRTAVVTIGNAAVHAARGLVLRRFFRQRNDEFVVVAHAIGGGLVLAILPINLEEAGHLAHGIIRVSRRPRRLLVVRMKCRSRSPDHAHSARSIFAAPGDARGRSRPPARAAYRRGAKCRRA